MKRKTIIIVILIAKIIIIVILIISSAADSMGAVSEGRLLPHQHNAHYAQWTFHVQCVIIFWMEPHPVSPVNRGIMISV